MIFEFFFFRNFCDFKFLTVFSTKKKKTKKMATLEGFFFLFFLISNHFNINYWFNDWFNGFSMNNRNLSVIPITFDSTLISFKIEIGLVFCFLLPIFISLVWKSKWEKMNLWFIPFPSISDFNLCLPKLIDFWLFFF